MSTSFIDRHECQMEVCHVIMHDEEIEMLFIPSTFFSICLDNFLYKMCVTN